MRRFALVGRSTKDVCVLILRDFPPRLFFGRVLKQRRRSFTTTMARNASAMELRLSSLVVLVLVVANLRQGVALEADARSAGYDELYADGLSAYYKDEWPTAVAKIEEAIKDWQRERNVTVTCRTECQDALAAEGRKSSAFAVEFFYSLNHMRSCADACIKENLGVRYKISTLVRSLFNNRAPFSFLQFAYHKVR